MNTANDAPPITNNSESGGENQVSARSLFTAWA